MITRPRHRNLVPEMRQILDVLTHLRNGFGHGTAAEIDQRMGRSEGYLGRVLRGEVGLSTDMLLRILQALEVDPGLFFQQVFAASPDLTQVLGLLRRRLEGASIAKSYPPPDPGSADPEVHQHLATWLDGVTLGDDAPLDLPEVHKLDTFDAQVFEAPEETLRAVEGWLGGALASQPLPTRAYRRAFARALEIEARAHLGEDRLPLACRRLQLAWGLVRDDAENYKIANEVSAFQSTLLCSSSGLALRSGAHDLALQLASEAMEHAVRVRDLTLIGRTLHLRGEAHFQAGDVADSLASFQGALRYLPETSWQDRWITLLGLARLHLRQGDVTTTHELLVEAESTHRTRRGLSWWHLMELQADLATLRQDWGEAAEQYRLIRRAYVELGRYLSATGIYLREARAWLATGNREALLATAASSMSLFRPLRRHRVHRGALTDMVRRALAGELTVEWLETVESQLSGSRKSSALQA